MMRLEEIRDWLKSTIPEFEGCIAVGAIDGNQAKYVGVYHSKNQPKPRLCLGGAAQTRYQVAAVSILVHWTNSQPRAEETARKVYDAFYGLAAVQMGDAWVVSAAPKQPPIPVGRDQRGIYEYVVEIEIYHERDD